MDAAHAAANAARSGNLGSGQSVSSNGFVVNSDGSYASGGNTSVYLNTNDTDKLFDAVRSTSDVSDDGQKILLLANPATTSTISIGIIREFGTESSDVSRMQTLLWMLGYYGIDVTYDDIIKGRFDAVTLDALIRFQLTFKYYSKDFQFDRTWNDLFDSSGKYYGCGENTSRMLSILYNDFMTAVRRGNNASNDFVFKNKYVDLWDITSEVGILSLHPIDHVSISGKNVYRDDKSEHSQARFIWDYMAKAWHLWPEQIAGIMGNIMEESRFSHTNAQDYWYPGRDNSSDYTFSATDGVGFGLVQWTAKERKNALLKFANIRGSSVWNRITQLEFMKYEMSRCTEYPTYNGVWEELLRTGGIDAVTKHIFDKYEQAGNQTLRARQLNAANIYRTFYNPKEFENW